MSHRARLGRTWLVLAYGLTLALAQAGHRHAPDSDETARCLASCQDARVHLSGHSSPDLDHPHHDCLACQFRADHQALPPPDAAPLTADVGSVVEASRDVATGAAILRASCRAPPLA